MTRIVFTLLERSERSLLSPFFARARWIGLVDTRQRSWRFLGNHGNDAGEVAARIIECTPLILVCGYIGVEAHTHLASSGIDVRLGPCSVPADLLVARAEALPRASETLPIAIEHPPHR